MFFHGMVKGDDIDDESFSLFLKPYLKDFDPYPHQDNLFFVIIGIVKLIEGRRPKDYWSFASKAFMTGMPFIDFCCSILF